MNVVIRWLAGSLFSFNLNFPKTLQRKKGYNESMSNCLDIIWFLDFGLKLRLIFLPQYSFEKEDEIIVLNID